MKKELIRNFVLPAALLLVASSSFADSNHVASGDKAMMKQESDRDARNTGRNERDKNGSTVLPEDQSNKDIYIQRTANIRKQVVSQDDLSTSAKNIKIITLEDGTVVLRGPVSTAAEKTKIESIAKQVSGNDPVISYIEF